MVIISYRSSHGRPSVKKVFLETSQNSQENTCARVSILIKLQKAPGKTNPFWVISSFHRFCTINQKKALKNYTY